MINDSFQRFVINIGIVTLIITLYKMSYWIMLICYVAYCDDIDTYVQLISIFKQTCLSLYLVAGSIDN